VTPEPLIFPEGVRFPRDDEFPAGYEADRERLARARLTTGYVRREHAGAGFRAFFEANVHAPQLWAAFRTLAEALLPAVAAPIVGVKDEDPILGPYTTRAAALAVLEPHARHLQHDGFLEFGLIYQVAGVTEEVFVRNVKYLQVWTNHPDRAVETFASLGLPEVPDLQFIDQFPRVSESLQTSDGYAEWPGVVEQLRAAFEELPPADRPPADV
jgi:hypothetical protein